MKKIFVLLYFLAIFPDAPAQFLHYAVNAAYLSALPYDKKFTGPFSCILNPAALPDIKGFSAGVYTEKKFMIGGLNLTVITAAFGKKTNGFGLNFRYFGNPDYNEIHAAVNYGKMLGNINIGVSFNYSVYTIASFESHSLISMTLASIWQLSDRMNTSLEIANPRITRLNNQAEQDAAEYRLGLGFRASPSVYLAIEYIRRENLPLQMAASLQYRFAERFYARAGLITNNAQPFFGAGWKWKYFRLEIAVSHHPALGSSPGILFIHQQPDGNIAE